MNLFEGKILYSKPRISDWPDEKAEIDRWDDKKKKWHVVVGGNFSVWLTPEEIEEDFEEI